MRRWSGQTPVHVILLYNTSFIQLAFNAVVQTPEDALEIDEEKKKEAGEHGEWINQPVSSMSSTFEVINQQYFAHSNTSTHTNSYSCLYGTLSE